MNGKAEFFLRSYFKILLTISVLNDFVELVVSRFKVLKWAVEINTI